MDFQRSSRPRRLKPICKVTHIRIALESEKKTFFLIFVKNAVDIISILIIIIC